MGSDPGGKVPRLNDLDTVPPPDGGDAYGNATVVRAAPSEILEAIRRERDRERPVDPRAEPEEPVTGSEGKFRAAKPAKSAVDDAKAKLEPKLAANAKAPAVAPKTTANAKSAAEPSVDDVDASWAVADSEAAKPAPPASTSESTDVEVPQGAEPSANRLPAMDAAALRPARVPQDFDKLMSQRTDASLVGMSAQPTAKEEAVANTSPGKRGKLVVSIVVGVLVLWLAVMAAVFAAHVGSR